MEVAWQAAWQHRPCHATSSPPAWGSSGIVGARSHASLARSPADWGVKGTGAGKQAGAAGFGRAAPPATAAGPQPLAGPTSHLCSFLPLPCPAVREVKRCGQRPRGKAGGPRPLPSPARAPGGRCAPRTAPAGMRERPAGRGDGQPGLTPRASWAGSGA